jgi:hypothetical protein
MDCVTRPRGRTAPLRLALASLLVLGACGDSRIRKLDVGISKDSMFKVLAADAPATDSLPYIYLHNVYLVDGKLFDVYFYDPQNRKKSEVRGVTEEEVTPIFLVDGKVDGWGWRHAEQLTQQFRIPSRADFLK